MEAVYDLVNSHIGIGCEKHEEKQYNIALGSLKLFS